MRVPGIYLYICRYIHLDVYICISLVYIYMYIPVYIDVDTYRRDIHGRKTVMVTKNMYLYLCIYLEVCIQIYRYIPMAGKQ